MTATMDTDPRQWASEQFAYLTTTGRVSGKPHTIEIWFALDPEDATRLAMMAGGGWKADWVRNLARTPAATVKIGTLVYPATAHIIGAGEPDEQRIRHWLVAKYRTEREPLTEWGHTALPVLFILHPDAAQPG